MPEDMLAEMSEDIICQIGRQTECQKICEIECKKICQIGSQKDMPESMPENMAEGVPEIVLEDMPDRMPVSPMVFGKGSCVPYQPTSTVNVQPNWPGIFYNSAVTTTVPPRMVSKRGSARNHKERPPWQLFSRGLFAQAAVFQGPFCPRHFDI